MTVEQMERGVARISKRLEELEAFDPNTITARWAPEVDALQISIKDTLADIFGHGSVKYNQYKRAADLDRGDVIMGRQPPPPVVRRYLEEGKKAAILV